jgi:D-glycero-alpha-D-manno-heptose 1-phosphate guanylyltransferase
MVEVTDAREPRAVLDVPLIVLAGGQGTRLRALESNRPKPMVTVCGQPFLHWLIRHYTGLGYTRFILSTGYKAEMIEAHPWSATFSDCSFSFHREGTPLGMGGAVQAIYRHDTSLDSAWVVNGDTLLPAPLPAIPSHQDACFSVLEGDQVFDAVPNLHVEDERVIGEKTPGDYFDAGAVFVTRRAVERYVGPLPCSLFNLLAPAMTRRRVGYALLPGTCYDIGTPARYRRFERYLESQNPGIRRTVSHAAR